MSDLTRIIRRHEASKQEALSVEELKVIADLQSFNDWRNQLLEKAEHGIAAIAKMLAWLRVNGVIERTYGMTWSAWAVEQLADRYGQQRTERWALRLASQYETVAKYPKVLELNASGYPCPTRGRVVRAAWTSCYYAVRIGEVERFQEQEAKRILDKHGPPASESDADSRWHSARCEAEVRMVKLVKEGTAAKLRVMLGDAYRKSRGLEPDGRRYYGGRLPEPVWHEWEKAVAFVFKLESDSDESGHSSLDPSRASWTQVIERVAGFLNGLAERMNG